VRCVARRFFGRECLSQRGASFHCAARCTRSG
jgi:hypothetical protein